MLGFHKRFPTASLAARSGALLGTISSSSIASTPLGLTHAIEIALAPFMLSGREEHATLRISSLALGVRTWRALARRDYRFDRPAPARQIDGEPIAAGPPGAIQLAGRHLPARARYLSFGAPAHGAIAATLHVTLELEPLGYRPADVVLSVALALGGVRVLGDLATLARPAPAEAEALARTVIDVIDYAPVARDGVVTYHPLGATAP